jgi:thioredoxin-like negative regulator of GroEL
VQIHQAARQLMTAGNKEQAMRVFQFNAKRYPNKWPVHVGLMRGYAAMGDKKKALDEARLALAQAPDEVNKKNLERMVKQLESGGEIN